MLDCTETKCAAIEWASDKQLEFASENARLFFGWSYWSCSRRLRRGRSIFAVKSTYTVTVLVSDFYERLDPAFASTQSHIKNLAEVLAMARSKKEVSKTVMVLKITITIHVSYNNTNSALNQLCICSIAELKNSLKTGPSKV